MVAVGGGAQYFKVKERMRRDIGAFKSTTRRFKFDNFRRCSQSEQERRLRSVRDAEKVCFDM